MNERLAQQFNTLKAKAKLARKKYRLSPVPCSFATTAYAIEEINAKRADVKISFTFLADIVLKQSKFLTQLLEGKLCGSKTFSFSSRMTFLFPKCNTTKLV